MPAMRRHSMISAGGFTYIGVLFAVVLAGVALTLTAEVWRIRRRGSLPYGVAIACGGAWVLFTTPGG